MKSKINAVFEEESKDESSSHKSDGDNEEDKKEMDSSSDPSIEDPRDHDANYGVQPEEGEQNLKYPMTRKSTDLDEDDFPDECGEEGVNMPYFNLININHNVLNKEKSGDQKLYNEINSLKSLRPMRPNGAYGLNNLKSSDVQSYNNLSVCASILLDNDVPRHHISKRGSINQHNINAGQNNQKISINSAMKHSVQKLRSDCYEEEE